MRSDNPEEHSDAFDYRITRCGALSNFANRFLFSRAYSISYLVIILLNVALIAWILYDIGIRQDFSTPSHWLFLSVEIIVNLAFLFEISLRLVSLKLRYFSSVSNLFDVVVLLFSLLSILVYFTSSVYFSNINDIISIILLILRYGIQLVRLYRLIQNQRKAYTAHSVVDFSTLNSDSIPLRDSTIEEEGL